MIINNVPLNVDVMGDKTKTSFVYPWYTWLQQIYTICFSIQQSGTTANRPVKLIWIGRRYFDISLGIPVWVQSANPTVWVNATGTPV